MSFSIVLFLILSWGILFIQYGGKEVYANRTISSVYSFIYLSLPPLIVGFYFVALRPLNAGGDTIAYLIGFSRISSFFTATADAGYGSELLFWPLQAIFKWFVDARGWLVINYLAIVTLTFFSYKKLVEGTRLSPLIFGLLFVTFFAVFSGNAMRQAYSIPLMVLAFHYFYINKKLISLSLAFFSVAFHWSALVVCLYPFFLKLPNNYRVYIAIPIAALVLSFTLLPVADFFNSLTGFSWLEDKTELYLKGGRLSHIDEVWKTANFWLCVIIYVSLALSRALVKPEYEKVSKYLLMFLTIMFFAIDNVDVSERFMYCFMFAVPLAVAMVLSSLNTPVLLRNILFFSFFVSMTVLVFTRESAKITLGIM